MPKPTDNSLPLKQAAAAAAVELVRKHNVIGMGTGSTVDCLIDLLTPYAADFEGVVASSERTHTRLQTAGFLVIEPNEVSSLPIYVDGADEVDPQYHMIKGGGGAMTREKICAAMARQFVVMIDGSKSVKRLFKAHPVPVEVMRYARSSVARSLVELGAQPVYRDGVTTDNGNVILDAYHLPTTPLLQLENTLNNLPGVVGHGLFAKHRPQVLITAHADDDVRVEQCET